jgi:hypothetical protein
VLLAAGVAAGAALAGTPSTRSFQGVDSRLCPFPLAVAGTRAEKPVRGGALRELTSVVLTNRSTGRTAFLRASGSATGTRFSGEQLWLGEKNNVPYLATTGPGRRLATGVVAGAALHRRVIDPCALVAATPPATEPAATAAPWGLPAYALSQIAFASLAPLAGKPTRHDHLHLDLIVDGRSVTIPAGIGQAEPVDRGPGPCPPPPDARTIGDCAPGHYFTAEVAASQLQTHSSSGIVHLQAERPGALNLGQFFDEWGVRFDASCLGAYCAEGGKELRVYVDGRRVPGDPRKLVLRDGREIAVVFGGPGAFRAVPSRYGKRMPAGCGGAGEPTCFPG